MNTSVKQSEIRKGTSSPASALTPTAIKVSAESTVPTTIYGVRLPRRHFFDLSDRVPKSGSMKSATMLSSAMMTPRSALPKLNVLSSILETMLSYTCQNIEIVRKTMPTKTVFFALSFIVPPAGGPARLYCIIKGGPLQPKKKKTPREIPRRTKFSSDFFRFVLHDDL